MFDAETKRWARISFSMLESDGLRAARAFHERLFELDPSTRAIFAGDLAVWNQKFLTALRWVLEHLDDDGPVREAARAIGKGHAQSGIKADQYATAGSALIHMFQSILGSRFTPEMEEAWLQIYSSLSCEMELRAAATSAP